MGLTGTVSGTLSPEMGSAPGGPARDLVEPSQRPVWRRAAASVRGLFRAVWFPGLWGVACSLSFLILLQEALPREFEYPPATPFHGDHWYNPYEGLGEEGSRVAPQELALSDLESEKVGVAFHDLRDPQDLFQENVAEEGTRGVAFSRHHDTSQPQVHWLRACFHTHSRSWGGATNGSHSSGQVVDAYRKRGYDLVGVSNYHSIRKPVADEPLYLECYEHGYGVQQHHFTVIGAPQVSWLDFPLYKRLEHKQELIQRLAERADIVVINHPNRRSAYTEQDMAQLVGYDGIEVATRYANGRAVWDAALTAGRRVWGFCGDDAHDFWRYNAFARGWVCIAAKERTREGTLQALREGRFYGVWNRRHEVRTNRLLSCDLEGDRVHVRFERPLSSIRVYSQTGIIRQKFERTDRATYVLRSDDPYIRIEGILLDKWGLEGSTYFLNPIYRYKGDPHQELCATVLEQPTARRRRWAVAGSLLPMGVMGIWSWSRRRSVRKRRD